MRYAAMDGTLGRRQQTAEAVLPLAGEAGLAGVEVSLRSDYTADPLWSPDGARAVRARARALGLEIPSLALLMLNDGGFTGDEATRARARAIVRRGIDLARELGAGIILLPFFGAGAITDERGIAQVIEELRALAPTAEESGVRLGIETTLPAPTVVGILAAVSSPAVTAYFDVANAVWLGYDPVDELETLQAAGALPQIHIKDIQERPGDRGPGEGRVPYPQVARALRRLGYDGYLVFETPATDDPVTAARRHRAFLDGLLAERT
ncbi:MAG TPA: sugar phosphate isomerase/epimerase family protein [Isosphaeraceae bacterium]|nr:sugar phosphate isomerase/epimerase family protein [Isosphaeraceae bacterium]